MGAPGSERVIERPGSRAKLKLRGRSALPGLSAVGRTRPGNRQDDRTRQRTSALPKYRPPADARNAAITDGRAFFSHRPKSRVRATTAGLSSVWAVAPGCMAGYLWPSTARRPLEPRIFPCRTPRKRGPRPAFLAHAPAAPKFVAPAGAQRCACPLPASGGLRLCFVFAAITEKPSQRAQPHRRE